MKEELDIEGMYLAKYKHGRRKEGIIGVDVNELIGIAIKLFRGPWSATRF
jgi:hypothetical protein